MFTVIGRTQSRTRYSWLSYCMLGKIKGGIDVVFIQSYGDSITDKENVQANHTVIRVANVAIAIGPLGAQL